MPRTVKEYQQRWQDALKPGNMTAPWDEELTATSCVIYETARYTPTGDGCNYFSDFGDVLCFYRYLRIPEELDTAPAEGTDVAGLLPDLALMGWSWSRYRSRFSTTEIRRRRYEGERALDKLLARFVREGYQPGMREKLIEIVKAALIDFELRQVYALPGDLAPLLEHVGNPLADCNVHADEASALPFDLNAQGHCEALAEHLVAGGR